ncbi:MAG: hypothetical protein AAF558_03800 [Verrucomicrobiota bacterium]
MPYSHFVEGIKILGIILVGGTILLLGGLALLILIAKISRHVLKRIQRQLLETAEQYAQSTYEAVPKEVPHLQWRRHLRQHESWLSDQGFSHLVTLVNVPSESEQLTNRHINFLDSDKTTLACLTYMTLPRLDPIIGLSLPLPRWTGVREQHFNLESHFLDGSALITMDTDHDCRWPDGYEVKRPEDASDSNDLLEYHQNRLKELITTGRQPRRWQSAEEYMQAHQEEHHMYAKMMQEDMEKEVEEIKKSIDLDEDL